MFEFPKIILVFLAVDWPSFTQKDFLIALAGPTAEAGSVVVAVNRPLCPLTTLVKKPFRAGELLSRPKLDKISENLFLYSPKYFIHDFLAVNSSWLKYLNQAAIRRSYIYLCRKLGVTESNPVVWFYYPRQGWVTELFPKNFNIYEIYDNISDIYGNENETDNGLEHQLRNRVHLLITTSKRLHDKYGQHYCKAIYMGNGLSRGHYLNLIGDDTNINPAIARIDPPRIGYAGAISNRLDWNLIAGMAKARPNWNFIFAGQIHDQSIIGKMAVYTNIHFTGAFEHNTMPRILRGFDIGLLPYLDTEFFRYLNPLKFYEYAAAGLPAVSSPIPELEQFPGDLIRVVNNDIESWLTAIEIQRATDRQKAKDIGREIAGNHIWEDMAAELFAEIIRIQTAYMTV
nr:glycosyltransferase [candidate division Zixibacteria bacterium]